MKKHIPNRVNCLSQPTIQNYCILFFLISLFSCIQKVDDSTEVAQQKPVTFNAGSAELPPPIKAKYIDPNSIAPPIVVPLKGKPKVVPAHPNVHPVGTPKVIQIPKELTVFTPGENGVPLPITRPAKGKVVPALQPKPIPALAARSKDAAIYNIKYLSDEEGFTGGQVKMIEDKRGHLWFSDRFGISRYDGKNFFKYTEKEGFLNGATSLVEDSKGNIWFGGREGICYYDGQNVTHFTTEEGLENKECRAIMEDSKGNIWFANGNIGAGNGTHGVYRYDGQNFTIFKAELGLSNTANKDWIYYSDNRIVDIMEDSNGHFWWATQGNGVLRYDGQHITHFTEKEGLIHNYISRILADSQGNIWFGSGGTGIKGKGISRYTPNTSRPDKEINGSFTNFTKAEGLSDNRITGMLEDEWGNIWFATYAGGINRYDGQNFTHFTKEEGLSLNGTSRSFLLDSQGNIWVGINGEGVNRFQPNSFEHFTEKQGLSKNWIVPILEDSKGNIWMGTYNGGVTKYDGYNFTHFTEDEGLLQNHINGIMEDKQGNVWFTTRDKGICRFDGELFTYYTMKQGFSWPFFLDIHEDKKGFIWITCGWQGGVHRLNPVTGEMTRFIGTEKGVIGVRIFEDSQHNLWFGGKGLLAKYDSKNDQINFSNRIDSENKDWVEHFIEDNQQNIWFGTSSRIMQVVKNGKELTSEFPIFTTGKELPNVIMKSLVKDNQQNLWIGSDANGLILVKNGLENIGNPDFQCLQYGKADGLKSNSYGINSTLLDNKNRLWWGTATAGVTKLDLNKFKIPTEAPENLGLSHLDIQEQFLDFKKLSDTTYSNTLAFGKTISQSYDSVAAFHNYPINLNLPYNLNHLTFHFSATDWSAPHKIKYSYQIEGLDNEWSQPSSETKADYRNLPFGTHTFKVKATGEAQIWSDPFEYTFTIRPPWWHTWWAYALYVLVTVGLVGWYIQRIRRQLKKEQSFNQQLSAANHQLEALNQANSRFVPNDFLKILGKESLLDLQLGDQTETTMTILFADIRDYTTLSEKISPEDNFKLINAFLGRMGPIIEANGGFICQYFGDGIMALFKEKHELVIQAAIEMQVALQRYNKKRFVRNREALRLGIGLNTGKLMLGVIGDKNRYDSSVISDAVNTASRMEGLTKIFGCGVIVSEKTLAEIDAGLGGRFERPANLNKQETQEKLRGNSKLPRNSYRFLGKVKVKGKNQTLKIYDFFDGDTEKIRQLKSETKADFEKAIHFYFDRKFGRAADLLKKIAEKFPEDIATEYYLTKAVKYVVNGVDANWSGVEEMVNK